MASEAVTVTLVVGEVGAPSPAVQVLRSNTITVEIGDDMEVYMLEALRMVDVMCTEVRTEALRQTRIIMENLKRQEEAKRQHG
jgi:hypothetical protein